MMDFPLQGAILASLSEGDSNETGLMKLYETLGLDFVYPDAANLVVFTGNHDTPRTYSLLREDLDSWKAAMAYMSVVQRIPQFFYGDELLFTSPRERADGVVRADFPGGFAGDQINGFTGEGIAPKAKEAQAWLRKLLNWRKGSAVIRDGALMHYAPLSGVYVMFRHSTEGKVMLVINKNKHETTLDTHRFKEMLSATSTGVDVLTGAKLELGASLKLPARGVMVIALPR
jgi:glycosidase